MTPQHTAWVILMTTVACASPRDAAQPQGDGILARLRLRGVQVQRKHVEPQATLIGRLHPYERAELAARASGVLEDLRVELGDRVRAGQVLAVLRVPGLAAQAAAAVAATSAAKQEVSLRDDASMRAHAIMQRNPAAIADQELRTVTGSLASARARASAAAADARHLSDLVADTRLIAPFDGSIVARHKDRGAAVRVGDAILDVARLDPLRLRLEVPELIAGLLRVGAPVRVHLPGLEGRTEDATISRFARALDPRTQMLPVEIDLKNPEGTRFAGMRAEVFLVREKKNDALVVPAEVVLMEAGESVVYVDESGLARRRKVRRGADNGVLTEILEGLAEKEVVLIGGRGLLRDGVAVEVAR